MRVARLFVVICGLAFVAAPALAQSAGGLTPEQNIMWMQQQRANIPNWQSLTPDQRHAQMRAVRQSLMAMSPTAKQKLAADLQAQFDALPPARQKALEQRIAEHQAKRTGQRPGMDDQGTEAEGGQPH